MKQIIATIFICCLTAVIISAQSTTGRLVGTVAGPDGLIPGATVTVTDNQTGREITQVSSDDGGFSFEQLSFGTYTVKVMAQGFKTFIATDVKIDANRDYTLKPILEVGSVEATVTVQAGADIVNSSNAELSNTVSPRQVLELPIDGRNPLSLINLQAGANPTSDSINGQRSSSVNYTRDGINVQDNFIRSGGFVQDRPSVDDTGEFAVITQNAGANFGGGGSAQVLLVTPRGGNEFHGALFAYNRNSRFAANDFGNNASNTPRPFLNRNQFGGKVSGPVPLPGFGEGTPIFYRDKGYFFVAYEKFILRQTAPITRRVLLNQYRNGNFTYRATNGTLQTVNVLTGAGLTAPIPATAGGPLTVDPTIQARFLALSPTSGNGTFQNISSGGALTQSFIFNQNDNDNRNALTMRFDVDVNDRNNINFVYKYNDNNDDRQTDGGGFNVVPFRTQGGPTSLYTAAWSTTLGSSFTNEVRGAYANSDPFFNQADSFPTNFLIGGLPFGLSSPEPSFQKQGRKTDQVTLQDNASYSVGNHTMRFGVDFNSQKIASETNFNVVPIFNISTTANTQTPRLAAGLFPGGISGADRAFADGLRYLLGGIVGGGTVAANFVNPQLGPVVGAADLNKLEYKTYGLYFGDQWRATPELTFNLGLRWDYFAPLKNPDVAYLEPDLKGAETFDQIRAKLLDPNGRYVLVGNNTGTPGQFFNGDKNNFGPIVSVAYSPRDKGGFLGALLGRQNETVIRGGFRIGYVNDEYVRSADNAAGGNAGLNFTLRAVNPVTGGTTLNSRFSNLPGFPAPPYQAPPITFAQGNARAGNFFNTVFAIDPNIQTQQVMEYNIGIQREIGWDTALEVRYVGGRSNSLVRGVDFNQVDITSNGFLRDFLTARNNCRILNASQGLPLSAGCADASGSQGLPGQSTNLPVFNALPFGAFLNNSAVTSTIVDGNAADLAVVYITNGLDGFINASGNFVGVPFRPNPNAGVVDLLANVGRFRHNALQVELRRRFTQGLYFQGNYTFGKTLGNIQSDQQTRFDPLLDNNNPQLEYARTDYDRKHTINFNTIYELPFGKGKPFLNEGGLINAIFGGIQFTSIINYSSGVPISIKDINGTLNRIGRSNRQTAFSNLTAEQIRDLTGLFFQNGRIYFINPSVIAPDGTAHGGSVEGPNAPGFPGQVFFRVQPGQTGNLPRNFFDGPWYFNWDAGLIKNIAFNERVRLQLRAEAFNVLNRTNFFIGENSSSFDLDSTTFGQIQPISNYGPRLMQFAVRFEF